MVKVLASGGHSDAPRGGDRRILGDFGHASPVVGDGKQGICKMPCKLTPIIF